MTWAKIDDQLHAHPKVREAWHSHRASIGLFVLALSHAGAFLTDGAVSEAFVRDQLPSASERRRAVSALVDAGLWEPAQSGWTIHDYLDFNESREQVLGRRAPAALPSRPPASRAPADGRGGADARSRAGARVPAPYPFPS